MSFTAEVKTQICNADWKECCRKAQLASLIQMCSTMNITSQGMHIRQHRKACMETAEGELSCRASAFSSAQDQAEKEQYLCHSCQYKGIGDIERSWYLYRAGAADPYQCPPAAKRLLCTELSGRCFFSGRKCQCSADDELSFGNQQQRRVNG